MTQKDDISEAYNFNLVRLANETRDYQCTIILSNRKKLLIVDRNTIVIKAKDSCNISDHAQIDIVNIIDIHVNPANNKHFKIEYKKHQTQRARVQVYELESAKQSNEFVGKVRYLKTLLWLLPFKDIIPLYTFEIVHGYVIMSCKMFGLAIVSEDLILVIHQWYLSLME